MSGYPTDEELERLIGKLEKQELYAPKHMKEQILSQAFPEKTVKEFPISGSRTRTIQNFTYRLKIVAGMAAAVIMLMVIPAVNSSRDPMQFASDEQNILNDDLTVNERLGERTREMNQKFNAWFDRVNSFRLETLFHMNDGGNYYEY